MTPLLPADDASAPLRTNVWILLLATSSVLFSFAFACATPFVALAAVVGTGLRQRDAYAAITLAWLSNQAIGFLFLHYPHTPSTFGWGLAIGLAALLATRAAITARRLIASTQLAVALGFLAAFVAYEGALLAATLVLPSSMAAFAGPVVLRIFAINAAACAGLLVAHYAAVAIGLLPTALLRRATA